MCNTKSFLEIFYFYLQISFFVFTDVPLTIGESLDEENKQNKIENIDLNDVDLNDFNDENYEDIISQPLPKDEPKQPSLEVIKVTPCLRSAYTQVKPCPRGWTNIEHFGRCYRFSKEKAHFWVARSRCWQSKQQSYLKVLVEPLSRNQSKTIYDLAHKSLNTTLQETKWFINVKASASLPKVFKYYTHSYEKIKASYWGPGANHTPQGNNVTVIMTNDGFWYPEEIASKHFFICEYKHKWADIQCAEDSLTYTNGKPVMVGDPFTVSSEITSTEVTEVILTISDLKTKRPLIEYKVYDGLKENAVSTLWKTEYYEDTLQTVDKSESYEEMAKPLNDMCIIHLKVNVTLLAQNTSGLTYKWCVPNKDECSTLIDPTIPRYDQLSVEFKGDIKRLSDKNGIPPEMNESLSFQCVCHVRNETERFCGLSVLSNDEANCGNDERQNAPIWFVEYWIKNSTVKSKDSTPDNTPLTSSGYLTYKWHEGFTFNLNFTVEKKLALLGKIRLCCYIGATKIEKIITTSNITHHVTTDPIIGVTIVDQNITTSNITHHVTTDPIIGATIVDQNITTFNRTHYAKTKSNNVTYFPQRPQLEVSWPGEAGELWLGARLRVTCKAVVGDKHHMPAPGIQWSLTNAATQSKIHRTMYFGEKNRPWLEFHVQNFPDRKECNPSEITIPETGACVQVVSDPPLNWMDAQSYCRQHFNYNLATLYTDRHISLLKDSISDDGHFVGINDIKEKGEYVTIEGHSINISHYWVDYEDFEKPYRSNPATRSCGVLFARGLEMFNCQRPLSFICQSLENVVVAPSNVDPDVGNKMTSTIDIVPEHSLQGNYLQCASYSSGWPLPTGMSPDDVQSKVSETFIIKSGQSIPILDVQETIDGLEIIITLTCDAYVGSDGAMSMTLLHKRNNVNMSWVVLADVEEIIKSKTLQHVTVELNNTKRYFLADGKEIARRVVSVMKIILIPKLVNATATCFPYDINHPNDVEITSYTGRENLYVSHTIHLYNMTNLKYSDVEILFEEIHGPEFDINHWRPSPEDVRQEKSSGKPKQDSEIQRFNVITVMTFWVCLYCSFAFLITSYNKRTKKKGYLAGNYPEWEDYDCGGEDYCEYNYDYDYPYEYVEPDLHEQLSDMPEDYEDSNSITGSEGSNSTLEENIDEPELQ